MSAKQCQNSCSGPPPVYQDLSTCHDWHVENAIVDLPIKMEGNSKRTSGNLLSPLVAQNKDIGSSSQMLLTKVKLHQSATKATCYTACILTNYAPLIMPPGAVLHLFSGVLLRQVFSCCQ